MLFRFSILALALFHSAASAGAATGVNDTDTFLYSIVKTISKDQPELPPSPSAACLLGRKSPGAAQAKYRLDISVKAGSVCDLLNFITPHIETVREFPAADLKPAFWNSNARIPAPRQHSLHSEIPGSDFNQALARLEAKCGGECKGFNLVMVHGGMGHGYSLPLADFVREPEALSVGYAEEKGSYEFDNVLIRVIRR